MNKLFLLCLFVAIGANAQAHLPKITGLLSNLSKYAQDKATFPDLSRKCQNEIYNQREDIEDCETYFIDILNDRLSNTTTWDGIERLFCQHIVNVQGCFQRLEVCKILILLRNKYWLQAIPNN